MLVRHQLNLYLTILSICLISSQNIEIKINPAIIIIGQDLFVSCSVTGKINNEKYDVFLRCPSNSGDSRCIQNCKSRESCNSCYHKAVGNQNFSCDEFTQFKAVAYNYVFYTVSQEFLNYSKTVNFACFYKDQQVNRTALVRKPITTTIMVSSQSTTPIIVPQRLIIILSLVCSLFISFLINVYCCVQWCIQKSKKKHRRRNRLNIETPLSYQLQDNNSNPYSNETSFQYISHDNIKRTKSQPSLSNDERNTPTRSNNKYSSLSNTGPRVSRPNTLTLDSEINNGSRNSLLTPAYGPPMVWAQIPFPDSRILYFSQYPQTYIHNSSIIVDNKSLNNLDCVVEQEGPERQNSSLFQPLPQKPDEIVSDLDSVFS